jgi:hypothetical protein
MSDQATLQGVYAIIGDAADGKVSDEELSSVLEAAGKQLDARQCTVVETLLTSK